MKHPVTAIEVRTDSEEWKALKAYAPWSINVELLDDVGVSIATFHDCGWSVTAELTDAQATELRERLAGIAPVTLLADVHGRRRKARRERRRARWRRWLRGGPRRV